MFTSMRKKSRQIDSTERVKSLLKNGEYGVFSSIGSDGYPYGVPVNYVYVKNNIYFHCAVDGKKLENIAFNSKGSFCVVTNSNVISNEFATSYTSIIAFGTTSEVIGDEKDESLLEIIKKYSPDFVKEGKEYIAKAKNATKVIKLNVEHITGKERK